MYRLLELFFWFVVFACFHRGDTSKSKQPNIVFVLADDFGFNDVGYHGSEIKTPNLDTLSASGVRLENYYVQPICTPSRSQLMSGRYQIHTGLQHSIIWAEQPNALPRDSPTVADKMKQAGYATHMVGKWHLGFYKKEFLPINRGFDTFYGYYTGSEDYFTHKKAWLTKKLYQEIQDPDKPVFDEKGRYTGSYKWMWLNRKLYLDLHDQDKPVYDEKGHYSAHLFTSKANERIRNHNSTKPLFLYVAYQSVHSPLQVPEQYIKPYEHITDTNRKIYAGMVSAMDEGIGNLTQTLKETGMWDNTVFVFSTDNGGQIYSGGNNYPLRGWKRSLWEGGMRGVGFVIAPNLQTAGTVSKGLIHISDWYPTFVGLAGGSLNDTRPLDGHDQWEAISKGVSSPRQVLLHNIDILERRKGRKLHRHTFDTRIRAALRVGDWKLITGYPGNGSWVPPPNSDLSLVPENTDYKTKNLWLFNITADPTEQADVSAQNPSVVLELLDMLLYFNGTAVPPCYPPYDRNSNPALHGGVWGPWE